MKNLRLLTHGLCRVRCLLTATVVLASDPTGSWKWTVTTGNGDIVTTAKLAAKDGRVDGYLQQFLRHSGSISGGTIKDDAIAFNVERDFNGTKITLQYPGTDHG